MKTQIGEPVGNSPAAGPQPQVLLAEGLQKSYGDRPALRGLSFTLMAGRILGFLGPNGAGKTTAIRILTTILEPDAGHFVVDGVSSRYPEEIRRRIGVLPESLGFPKDVTGIEYLSFFGQLFGRRGAAAMRHGLSLLEEVGLEQRARSPIGSYSRGMRQRLGIARALVNDPVVTFLDEPTLGLDPRGQQDLLALVLRIARERGVGVILCSHLLPEVEGICDDVVILSSGQVVAKGSLTEVAGNAKQNSVRVRVPPGAVAKAQQVLEAGGGVVQVTAGGEDGGWLQVEAMDGASGTSAGAHQASNAVLEALLGANIPVITFETEGGRLQDVYLRLTDEGIR